MRGLPAGLVAALRDDTVRLVFAVELHFDSGTERLHSGLGPLTFGGNTYQGAGDLAEIGILEEGTDLSPYAITLGLSGIDQDILAIALGEQYYNRGVTVYLGAISDAGALVTDPVVVFSGYIQSMSLVAGDPEAGDSVTLTCESELALLDRSSNLKYTDIQLQSEYPGDKGLEYLEQMEDARPVWRGSSQALAGTGSRPIGR